MPYGVKALFGAIPSAGIVFAYLGFEQADQLAGEIKNPQRNLPLAIITACLIGIAIYFLLQLVVHRRDPAQPDQRPQGLGGHTRRPTPSPSGRSPAWRAWSGSAGWRSSCGSTRSSRRSAPA